MSNVVALNLEDLVPQASSFSLDKFPGQAFKLGAYTLGVQIWVTNKYGKERWNDAVAKQDIEALAGLAYHVLDAEGRKTFPTFEDFLNSVVTYGDRRELMNGVLTTMGLSQPVLKKATAQLEDAAKKKPKPQKNHSTGASSTI